jgi:hypothetical protein
LKLALDENLPPALAHAVNALLAPEGGQAISIPERYGRSAADREWITALHDEGGWTVLTADRRIRSRPHERLALEQSGLIVFLVAHGLHQESYWIKVAAIIRWIPAMMIAVTDYRPPVLFIIPHRWSAKQLQPLPVSKGR